MMALGSIVFGDSTYLSYAVSLFNATDSVHSDAGYTEAGYYDSCSGFWHSFAASQSGFTCAERCKSFPDIPGEEMQHDTSDYYIKISEKKQKVICSGLYFRYSKLR